MRKAGYEPEVSQVTHVVPVVWHVAHVALQLKHVAGLVLPTSYWPRGHAYVHVPALESKTPVGRHEAHEVAPAAEHVAHVESHALHSLSAVSRNLPAGQLATHSPSVEETRSR